jgi:hypothetical protein
MRANEFIIENTNPAKAWIEKVYQLYPTVMQNNHVMMWGEGEDQQFAMFELTPSFSKRGAVEVKWFQAYPLRQGVGSKAMAELQRLAREDGINLTLFPWDKGQVSQSKLTKFYKGHGFKPVAKGSKSLAWDSETPVDEAEGTPSGVPHLSKKVLQHIIQQVGTEGAHAIVKSLEWGDGAAKELLALIVKDLKQDVGMGENFKDGRHPEDKGDSARHGIPKHATIGTLKKIAKQGGRKGQLAHWQANMRSGRNKHE